MSGQLRQHNGGPPFETPYFDDCAVGRNAGGGKGQESCFVLAQKTRYIDSRFPGAGDYLFNVWR